MLGRIRCVLRWALCALVVFGLLPGAAELVENLEHLVHDGHLRHGAAHEVVAADEACGEDEEHGCTPLDHHCGCCTSLAGLPETAEPPSAPVVSTAPSEAHPFRRDRLVSRVVPPWVRPPIA